MTVTPEFDAQIQASIARAQSIDPAELRRQQDAFNADPEKVATFWARRAADKRRRKAAEAEYYAGQKRNR
jgi:hypothetical protein